MIILKALFGQTRLMNAAGEGGEPGGGAPVSAPVDKAPKEPVAAPLPVTGGSPKGTEEESVLDKAGFAESEDDPGLNYALNFLASNGFNSSSPSVLKALEGDFSLLKAELASKGVQGWEQAISLAEQSYERHVAEMEGVAEQVGGIVTQVAEQFGVDWEQAAAHVGSTAKPEEREALNSLLTDPATAHIAASYIATAFINGGDVEIAPQAKAVGDGSTRPTTAGGTLSRQEYTQELAKLRKTLGDDYINSPQAQALYQRLAR